MIRRPPREDIERACEWLDVNEGEDGEADACRRVSTWLLAFVDQAEDRAATERSARDVARRTGVSLPVARAALKRIRRTAS